MTRSINQNAAEVMVSQDSEHVWDSGEHHKLNGEARSAIAHLCEKGECAIEDLAQHLKVTPGHTRRLLHDAIENHLVRERITDAGGIVLSARHAVAALHAGAAKIRGKDVSGLKSTFLSGVGRYILTSVGAIALAYLTQIFLARWLGPKYFGYYSMAATVGILLSMLGSLGFPMSMGRFMPQYLGEKGYGYFKGLFGYATRMALLTSALLCAIAFPFMTYTGMPSAEVHVMWFALALVPLSALGDVVGPALKSQKLWLETFLPKMLIAPALLLVSAWLMHQKLGDLTAGHMMMALLFATAVSVGLEWLFVQTKSLKEIKQAKALEDTKKWLHASLPTLVVMLFGVIVNRADLILVGIIAGHHEAGIYAVALFTAELVSLFKNAGKTVIPSIIGPLFYKKEYGLIKALGGYLSRLAFACTLVGAGLIAVFGKQLLGVFGAEFAAGYQALLILLVMQLLRAASGVPGLLLIMTGKQTELVKVYSLSVVVQIALLALLLPRYGILGAAIATTITEILAIISISATAKRATGLTSGLFTKG